VAVADKAQQASALKMLCEFGSHGALGKADVAILNNAFPGLNLKCYREKANVHPKGLLNPSLKKGATVECLGGWIAAASIARHLGAKYMEALGRGTEFWRAMEAIRKTLGLCPRCGGLLESVKVHNATSRRDSKTVICPPCGVAEAMEDAGLGG
jgi:predicted RNA-binding Zn-ribbon protein involved in translation (DUF1610 family)